MFIKKLIKTKLFKISVVAVYFIIVILIIIDIKNISYKYSGFYFKKDSKSYYMTKLPIFSYAAEYNVINRYYYKISAPYNQDNIIFDLTYAIVNNGYRNYISGSVTFGDETYKIDDSDFIIKEKDKTINSLYIRADNKCFYIPLDKDMYILKSAVIRNIDCQSHKDASYNYYMTDENNFESPVKRYEPVDDLKEYVTTYSESGIDILYEDDIEVANINTGSYIRRYIKDYDIYEPDYIGLKCSIPVVYSKKSGKYVILLSDRDEYAESVFEMRKKIYKIMKDAFESNICPTYYDTDQNIVEDIVLNKDVIIITLRDLLFTTIQHKQLILDRKTYKTLYRLNFEFF